MTFYIVPIVEGQTEVGCIERLLWRIWTELLAAPIRLQVLPASRGKRDALINRERHDLSEKIDEAYAKLVRYLRHDPSSRGLLLLLLDAEGDCPAELAPILLEAARTARSDATIACVLANRMLENWIKGGASTLAGVNGLPDQLPARDNFEERQRSGVAGGATSQSQRSADVQEDSGCREVRPRHESSRSPNKLPVVQQALPRPRSP